MEPVTFTPLYMQRVWGGRTLATIYGRTLPDPTAPIGESWEIVDRPAEQSVVDAGPLAGLSLHELWNTRRAEIFGAGYAGRPARFPVLIKILDARDDLSVQVHPPAAVAATLGGEPKTEMWYIADCEPGAKLYVGLKHGVSRRDFERSIDEGRVAETLHAIEPRAGDSIFIPSGRLHAIGGGFLIHEIQQTSDTTYRVFDWNRVGLDGRPRELHVTESLASIDFDDFEPGMDAPEGPLLAACDDFATSRHRLAEGERIFNPHEDAFSILSIIDGRLRGEDGRGFGKGRVLLMPAGAAPLIAEEVSTVLQTTLPR